MTRKILASKLLALLLDALYQSQVEIGQQPPFETREKTLLHPLKLNRRFVTGQYQLLARLVEVVEYVEECVLRLLLAGKLVDVINNQNVNHLVKMEKVVLVVVPY